MIYSLSYIYHNYKSILFVCLIVIIFSIGLLYISLENPTTETVTIEDERYSVSFQPSFEAEANINTSIYQKQNTYKNLKVYNSRVFNNITMNTSKKISEDIDSEQIEFKKYLNVESSVSDITFWQDEIREVFIEEEISKMEFSIRELRDLKNTQLRENERAEVDFFIAFEINENGENVHTEIRNLEFVGDNLLIRDTSGFEYSDTSRHTEEVERERNLYNKIFIIMIFISFSMGCLSLVVRKFMVFSEWKYQIKRNSEDLYEGSYQYDKYDDNKSVYINSASEIISMSKREGSTLVHDSERDVIFFTDEDFIYYTEREENDIKD